MEKIIQEKLEEQKTELSTVHIAYLQGKINENSIAEEVVNEKFINALNYAFKSKAKKYCQENSTNHIDDNTVLDWVIDYLLGNEDKNVKVVNTPTSRDVTTEDEKEPKREDIKKPKYKTVEPEVEDGQINLFDLIGE